MSNRLIQNTVLFFSFFASFVSSLSFGADPFEIYQPQVLTTILERVEATVKEGKTPIVLFDLDDTLLSSRTRSLAIFREAASTEAFKAAFPVEAERISKLGLYDIRFQLTETMRGMGITNEDVVKIMAKAFSTHFFTNEYSVRDPEILEASRYVRELHKAGAQIVYLTGRDEPRMGIGTRKSLVDRGFPFGERAILKLKPLETISDIEFKSSVFAELAQMGEMVATFENEPENLNAMHKAFPKAYGVFVDTNHSPTLVRPFTGSYWISTYFRCDESLQK